ncbi:MAG: putative Pre-mRNA-splicing factor cwc26 [Streblomastix strix]|uniref:Putative Pre-mRNA-splicing factor cwc26 n=1 Tax=Streblomastix strix TaxID=222440 RepID=A0A5J4VVA3_9EUKA|nr:MAG: putative Pre-mRNA-splicing factor cwc26 [Streblomastix strix]
MTSISDQAQDVSPPRQNRRRTEYNERNEIFMNQERDISPPRRQQLQKVDTDDLNDIAIFVQSERRKKELFEQKTRILNEGEAQKKEKALQIEKEKEAITLDFARGIDDVTMNAEMKEELRAGDPMRDYMMKQREKEQKKKEKQLKKERKAKGEESDNEQKIQHKQKYKGPPAPQNRFGIEPGYMWDGKDRGNGFETQWFAAQNEKDILEQQARFNSVANF